MIYFQAGGMSYTLGNKIFKCNDEDRYVLCNSEAEAEDVMNTIGINIGEIKKCASLDDTSKLVHLCGERVTVYHRNNKYVCDTLLALGAPYGVDTTKSLKLQYRRAPSDID